MVIASWNVNSIRARMGHLKKWLEETQPDLLALQETKVDDPQFPHADLADTGYHVAIHGQKSYNGVAILSREPLESVSTGYLPGWPSDCRVQVCRCQGVAIINTYVPNGTFVPTPKNPESPKWEYKMKWLEAFPEFVEKLKLGNEGGIWMGDINIAPGPDDVWESAKHLGDVGHHPDEFKRLDAIKERGWEDLFRRFTQGEGHYTFWDFRTRDAVGRNLGWRIDHIYALGDMQSRVEGCWIDKEPRTWEKASDHCPILAELTE